MYRLKLHSPLHIGSNHNYTAMQYLQYINDDELYIYPMDTVIQHLEDEQQIWEFTKFLEKNPHQNSREANTIDLQQMLNKKMVSDTLYDAVASKATVKFPLEKREIAATLKTMNRPYIPGGTIKGMIRTALVYAYAREHMNAAQLESLLKFDAHKRNNKTDLFLWISSNFNERPNIMADCFRFVHIPDVALEGDLGVVLEKITTQKAVSGNDNAIEVILPGAVTEPFTIQLDTRGIAAAKAGAIKDKHRTIEFNSKLLAMLTEEKMCQALADYFEAVADVDQLYWEDSRSVHKNFGDLHTKMDEWRDENSRQQPMVRLGKSTGYLWHTIGALFMDTKHKQIADRNLDRFLSDSRPKFRPNSLDEYPKSRKFVEISKMDGFDLLGFAQLEQVK